jgi:ATP-binding cassette subfamily B protein
MTYGTVTAIIQLVNQVQSPFVSLSGIMPKYYTTIASAERIMELDDLPNEKEINQSDINVSATYKSLKSIEFENISFKFDRDIILDNTSLSIKKGDFVAIMGISGIGKSTLLKLLLGVFNLNFGKIYLDTNNGKIPIDKNTRKLFSYVPQGNMLISGTIKDNITFINPDASDAEIEEAIRISCAKQFIDELPLGLETVIGEKGLGLSEGQVQRLAIARSLLADSPILLLDEATSALDEKTEKEFLTNLKALDNVTCIIVSHKKAALDICNKTIQIKNGKIISEG